jgi:carboxypeptidase Q
MTNSGWWGAVFLFFSLLLPNPKALAQSDADRILDEALKPSPIEENLRRLTDEIGGRVSGTPAMQKAVDWGMEAFKAAGADRVHTEEFQLPVTWAEGATEVRVEGSPGGKAAHPGANAAFDFKLRAVSIAWAPPVIAKHVPVVDVGFGTPGDFRKAGDVSGKLLLIHTDVLKTWPDLFNEYMRAPPVIE